LSGIAEHLRVAFLNKQTVNVNDRNDFIEYFISVDISHQRYAKSGPLDVVRVDNVGFAHERYEIDYPVPDRFLISIFSLVDDSAFVSHHRGFGRASLALSSVDLSRGTINSTSELWATLPSTSPYSLTMNTL
jgi:hypothetical protein